LGYNDDNQKGVEEERDALPRRDNYRKMVISLKLNQINVKAILKKDLNDN
jgi:hypothetical protein